MNASRSPKVQFESLDSRRAMELKAPFEETLSLTGAAEMAVILKGVIASLPFLPL